MESATIKRSDRELGYRLGSVMLSCFGADGGAAIRAIDESGLTFTQMKVLMTLAGPGDGAPGLKPVAEGLGLSLPSVSRAVDGLVQRELGGRPEDPAPPPAAAGCARGVPPPRRRNHGRAAGGPRPVPPPPDRRRARASRRGSRA